MIATECERCVRVVLTGGPGGGKTTAADLFRREIGQKVVIVPEAATLLYRGGFPRSDVPEVRVAIQKAIYHVQRNLEDSHAGLFCDRVLLCDRGTIDGAAYWPGDSKDYFKALGTSLEEELERYDAVFFFETAAVAGISIEGGNPERIETLEQAKILDAKLRSLWSKHKNFHLISHQNSFMAKINGALGVLKAVLD